MIRRWQIVQRRTFQVVAAASFAAVLLCAVAVQPALGQAETPEPTRSEPVVASVKLFLNDITKFDPTTGFTADVFLGVVCETPCGDPKIVVDNGKATAREVLVDTPQTKGYRMELTLTDTIDLHQYPFDSQPLSIVLTSVRPAEEFRFAAPGASAKVGDIKLQGWQLEPEWQVNTRVSPPDDFTLRSFPVYELTVTVSRPLLAGILKVVLPGLAILLVGSLGLIIGPDERIKRFDLFNAAFLGTVLFQLTVIGSLPPLGYLTFADRFLIVNLVSIIIGVVSSVWIIVAFRAGRKSRSWVIHEWSMVAIPLVWLGLQSLNVLGVFVFARADWRLLAICVAELLVGASILAWRARKMDLGSRFRSAYRRAYNQSRDSADALKQALDVFVGEPPLAALTRADVAVLADVFSSLPDPLVVVDVLEGARAGNDVAILKDRAELERFAAYIADREEQVAPAVPGPSPAT